MAIELITLKEQHPQDDLDHAVSFSEWIDTGDTLASCTVTVPSGITLGSGTKAPAISGLDVVFWLTGGDSGNTYYPQVAVVTANGRRKVVDGSILILDPTPT
jgi:hypothetical protein